MEPAANIGVGHFRFYYVMKYHIQVIAEGKW